MKINVRNHSVKKSVKNCKIWIFGWNTLSFVFAAENQMPRKIDKLGMFLFSSKLNFLPKSLCILHTGYSNTNAAQTDLLHLLSLNDWTSKCSQINGKGVRVAQSPELQARHWATWGHLLGSGSLALAAPRAWMLRFSSAKPRGSKAELGRKQQALTSKNNFAPCM